MNSSFTGMVFLFLGLLLLGGGVRRLRAGNGGQPRRDPVDGGPDYTRWDLQPIGLLSTGAASLVCGVGPLTTGLLEMVATAVAVTLMVVSGVCLFWFMGSVLYNMAQRARRQRERAR